jgi:signal transduction histidine kinase/CHASE1-domain containing sensor protein
LPEWSQNIRKRFTPPENEEMAASPAAANTAGGDGDSRRFLLSSMRYLRDHFAATAVFILGMALSAAAFVGTHHYFRSGEEQEFERQAAHYVQTVVNATRRYEQYVLDVAQRFEQPAPLDRWQFDEFAQDLRLRHKSLLSLAWIPLVPSDRRNEFEAKAQDDGLIGFRISEAGENGKPRDAGPRDFYFPIYYAVPFDLDREYLGIDLYSLKEFRPLLDSAGEGGHPVALSWSRFGSSDTRPADLQILRPVYDTSENADIGSPRRQRLRGFVAGAFKLDSIASTVINDLTTPAWLDVYIYRQNGNGGRDPILFLPSRLVGDESEMLTYDELASGLVSLHDFTVANIGLTVAIKPVTGKYGFESSILPYWAGSFGVLLTLFISYSLVTAQSRTRIIERTVADRTAALSNANISLHNEILERQRAEMEMRHAKDQAEVANRAKSEFLAMVSHELRTPLNAIIGFSEIIAQEVFGPVTNRKYAEYIGDIRKSGTHLLGLINNILDLSKVESGQFKLNEEKIRLEDGISEVMRFISELAQMGSINVKSDIPDNLPELRGDRQAIRQILLNLLSNAIKFTEEDGDVSVSAQLDQAGRLVLAIEDTGIGIPGDLVESVFEPFIQVDSSLARKFEGTGLGLPLTRSLVELHGGSVDLRSKLGKGTKVTVIFPRERVVGAITH